MPRGPKVSKRASRPKRVTPTAVRRFFFKLELLSKRRPDLPYEYSNLDPIVETPPPTPPSRDPFSSSYGLENVHMEPSIPSLSNNFCPVSFPLSSERVALMNEDPAMDALIITKLETVPFCCHEDLLTMTREQLLGVACVLNKRLPTALSIDTDRALATSWIRASIERLVGLRPDVPGAPKGPRLLTDLEMSEWHTLLGGVENSLGADVQMDRTPPTSPLARRSQNQSYGRLGSLLSPGGLHRLVEEDEGDEDSSDVDGDCEAGMPRHSKKCRIIVEDTGGESDESDVDMASDPELTPTPLPRVTRMQRASTAYPYVKVPTSPTHAPTSVPVLRSRSQPAERVSYSGIDTAFMDDKRPLVRYQRKIDTERSNNKVDSEPLKPIGAPRRSGRLRPIARSTHDMKLTVPSEPTLGAKRKRNINSAETARGVVSSFQELTVRCGDWMDDTNVHI